MAPSSQHLRIFISSPSDLADERGLAAKVVDDLDHSAEFRNHFRLQPLRWDDPQAMLPMPMNQSAQKSVDRYLIKPSQCDLVVVILYSKLGTPVNMDGEDYLSGTHYELSDALRAGIQTWVYLRTDEPPFKVNDPDFDLKYAGYKRLHDFIANLNPQGHFDQPYNRYEKPEDFRKLFENQLTVYLRDLRDSPVTRQPAAKPDMGEREPWPGSPFPGLRAFTEADAPIFFGRGREADELVKRVGEARFCAVVGASGSGKSSLVGAGLIPRLRDNAIMGSKNWSIVVFTPTQDPFKTLAGALLKGLPGSDIPLAELELQQSQLAYTLAENPRALITTCDYALRKAEPWAEVFLFVDQFEELFTLVNERQCKLFAALLKVALTSSHIRVVVTMRSDFAGRCAEVGELADLMNAGSYYLAAPDAFALLEMIERPAERAGLVFAEGLARQIVSDTGDEPGALALMAYVLDELYQARQDGKLTAQAYQKLDGVKGAIGRRAESSFDKLNQQTQAALSQVFRELVEVDERGTATRQRVLISQVASTEEARKLIAAFTDARLLTTSQVNQQAQVEVAHEALFRSWSRLAEWITTAQEDLILRRQVKQVAQEWDVQHRPEYLRWPAERLNLVYAMQMRQQITFDPVIQAFVEPEQERLIRELEDLKTSHQQRLKIGERLAIIGDRRKGVGVQTVSLGRRKVVVPEIDWCPVEIMTERQGRLIKHDAWPTIKIEDQTFEVQPFFIARYLITYQQYQVFTTDQADYYANPRWWRGMTKKYQQQELIDARSQFDNTPRDNVSWYQAIAFCRWLDVLYTQLGWKADPKLQIRLPTDWEWQWAAQAGNEQRKYSWGIWDDQPRANTREAGIAHMTAVGMYPSGAAACGALDMAGNLFEWCLNDHFGVSKRISLDNDHPKVLRGGSFLNFQAFAAASTRTEWEPGLTNDSIGFRVVLGSPIKAI